MGVKKQHLLRDSFHSFGTEIKSAWIPLSSPQAQMLCEEFIYFYHPWKNLLSFKATIPNT